MSYEKTATVEECWYPSGSDLDATHRIDADITYRGLDSRFEDGEVSVTYVVAYAHEYDIEGRVLTDEERAAFVAERPELSAWLIDRFRDQCEAREERRLEARWDR